MGRTSKFPLIRLAAKYKSMQTDGRLLSNRHSIEIVRYRVGQLLERIDINDAPDRMMKLGKLWKKFSHARYHGDELEVVKLQKELDAQFEAINTDFAVWKQMFEALDLEKNLVESEVRIAKDLRAILTAEDAYEMIAKIFSIIMEVETDPRKLKRYQYEFVKLTGDGKVVEAEWEEERQAQEQEPQDLEDLEESEIEYEPAD